MNVDLDYFSRHHWNRVADARGASSSEIGTALIDSLVGLVHASGARSVLDVGSGNGALSCALAAAVPESQVSGLDYSDVAVRIATEKLLPALPLELQHRLSFSVGSASELPYEDAQFDAVTMLKTAWVLPDLPAALRECRRVLRPGGSLHVQSWGDPDACAALTLGSGVLGDSVEGFELPPEAMAPFELTPERLHEELTAAGFRVDHQHPFSWQLTVDSPAQYWDRLRSIAGTAYWVLAAQSAEDREALDAAWQLHSAEYRREDGTVGLPLGWYVSVGTAV
ncbi:methyltransferase domain-containing protein [Kitasatospora sp. McL0602]|uniref:class I SAM-dependent methyltransferase n=1 Tax=Kitasatospora sp. McL0602 TaxID=3439530 RepID=UPI003F8ACDA2